MSTRFTNSLRDAPISGLDTPKATLMLILLVIFGCGSEPDMSDTPPAPIPASSPDSRVTMTDAPSTVEASISAKTEQDADSGIVADDRFKTTVASWEDIAAAVKESGKPSIVDVWSLACEPCMKEFPGLVKLHEEYGQQLNCVSVNVDFDGRRTHPPEGYTAQVMQFLRFNNAELKNYICATPNDIVFETIDIVSIPAVIIFDAEGNEIARFVDAGDTRGFTYEKNVTPAVKELLASSGTTPTIDE